MKKGIVSILVCLVVVGIAIGYMNWRAHNLNEVPADETVLAETSQTESLANRYNSIVTAAEADKDEPATKSAYIAREEDGALVIGAEDAPVTITEYSSLSCSHCASFHKNTLPDVKKDYIDTGIVKFVFRDFPTNDAAMDAAKLLKCVATEDRYEFMNLLFEQQLQWALPSVDRAQKLSQYAALVGLSGEKTAECMNDKEIEMNIIKHLQAANAKYGVDSTPTFVINPGDKVLIGARPYGDFSTEIEALTKQGE